ncbi:Baseplate hub assembly protein, bacteriophage T4-like [uncultured Caudovirales phage]|uniref:Baseplate hub assembly protein, bacteriophage T4-like n=1 Tax=uncultured Caudovirales phage TaxID=2100421 RepID=A0A6J7WWC2_9CAUD|nr:Baseplate hub assembly protein, bacteriophage T4-like [uncultured Caudovirales phage]
MPLPEIKHPIFKLTIPSTKKTVSYRPYTVKEEKLLLTVRMSDDLEEVIETLKQVINNCILDDINIDKLAMFDIEYIFVNLRKVSVSNEVEMFITHEDKKIPFTLDLDQIKVVFKPDHTNVIQINEDLGIKMKYPNMKQMLRLDEIYGEPEYDGKKVDDYLFEIFIDCIDNIFDNKKVYTEFTREELEIFMLSLPVENNKKILEFFRTMPTLEHTVSVKLPDGTMKEAKLSGLRDFFTF